jgi:hypothetical protein
LAKELSIRKQEYKDYIRSNIGRNGIRPPQFTEENYNIMYEEAAELKMQNEDLRQEAQENEAKIC